MTKSMPFRWITLFGAIAVIDLGCGQAPQHGVPVLITDRHGTLNTKDNPDFNETNYILYFSLPESDEMLYLVPVGNYRTDALRIAGETANELYQKYGSKGINCYYLVLKNRTNVADCKLKAEQDKCAYLEDNTGSLLVTYNSNVRPEFGLVYTYAKCSDIEAPTQSTTTTTTTSANSTLQGRVITPDEDAATKAPADSDDNVMTTTDQKEEPNDQKTMIIAVVVAAVLFVIIVFALLFFGIRFSRYRGQKNESEIQKQRNESYVSPSSPGPDALYEEILPVLPARNANMQDPSYEIPISAMQQGVVTPEERTKDGSDYITIQNELYNGVNISGHVEETENLGGESAAENSDSNQVHNVLYVTS